MEEIKKRLQQLKNKTSDLTIDQKAQLFDSIMSPTAPATKTTSENETNDTTSTTNGLDHKEELTVSTSDGVTTLTVR